MHQTGSASWSVEVVYRGIFQKRLANRISRGVVLAARREGKVGTAFARYGDSPERNGIPAKNFAVVATDEVELESSLARYEPESVEVSIVRRRHHVQGHRVLGVVRRPADQQAGRARRLRCSSPPTRGPTNC